MVTCPGKKCINFILLKILLLLGILGLAIREWEKRLSLISGQAVILVFPISYSEYRFTAASKYELSRKKTYAYDTYKQKDIQVAYADFNIIYDVVSGSGLSSAFDYYNDLYSSPASSRLNESDFIYGCYNIPAAKPLLRSETDETYEGSQTI